MEDQKPTEKTVSDIVDDPKQFNPELIKRFPRSNRKLSLQVKAFGLEKQQGKDQGNGQSVHISPHGIEFRTSDDYEDGTLLKIMVALPDYWNRKQKLVDYSRIDSPAEFRVLGKVTSCEDVGKRGKKKLVTVQTLIIDEVDEEVLRTYLQEG